MYNGKRGSRRCSNTFCRRDNRMNITLNLLGKPNKLSTFLLVWQGANSEYFCEFIHDKDYETAEYAILQILPKTGINNAILYKSAVKLNNTNKQHVFRVYVPIAFYSGDKYKLTKLKECVIPPIEIWRNENPHLFAPPIEIWRNEKPHWQADYIIISSLKCDEIKTAIYTNFDRVYGRKKK